MEHKDLITSVGDIVDKSGLDDSKAVVNKGDLEAASFEEFLDKFSPVVYSWLNSASKDIQYVLGKPGDILNNCVTEILLNGADGRFDKPSALLESDCVQRMPIAEFHFDEVLDLIAAENLTENEQRIRRERGQGVPSGTGKVLLKAGTVHRNRMSRELKNMKYVPVQNIKKRK